MSHNKAVFDGEEYDGPIGTVITVMGTPKNASPSEIMRAVNEISEVALGHFTDVEVAHLRDTPLITATALKQAGEDMESEYFATPVGRAAATIFAGAMHHMEKEEDREEAARRAAMSDEEREEEERCRDESAKRIFKKAHENTLREIKEGVENAFDIAEKWSHTPNLSHREVAHGVAHDMYAHLGCDYGKPSEYHPQRDYPPPSQNYQNHYTEQFNTEVQNRSMRSARELFGPGSK